ncbi:ATP-binding protein [Sulfuriroseicoccus oceanibius]|uniref:Histidine kinase/HSP90-like ATPase domain-containing protein n=1 Tax=Sulfuriroseicoccus oceanibius TaxID=2707525 RepID=A0A6B3L8S1_9BACT|nr:ATP-binding protein [Sulfuriroseicoccus oceanibius]QQL45805.1 hypothetical protein G3M56_004265 [Sulfuriroseicoccus oceanibius]
MSSSSSSDPCRTLLVDGDFDSPAKFSKVMADVGFDVDRCGMPADGVAAFDRHELVVLMIKEESVARSAQHFMTWLRNHEDTEREPMVVAVGAKEVIRPFAKLGARVLDADLDPSVIRIQLEGIREAVQSSRGGSRRGGFWSRWFSKSEEPAPLAEAEEESEKEREVASLRPSKAGSAKSAAKLPDLKRASEAVAKSGEPERKVSKTEGAANEAVKPVDAKVTSPAERPAAPTVAKPLAKPGAPVFNKPLVAGEDAVAEKSAEPVATKGDEGAAKAAEKPAKVNGDPFLEQLAKADRQMHQTAAPVKPEGKGVAVDKSGATEKGATEKKSVAADAKNKAQAPAKPAGAKSPPVIKGSSIMGSRTAAKEAKKDVNLSKASAAPAKGKTSRLGELEMALDSEIVARKKAEDRAKGLEQQLERKTKELVGLVDSLSTVAVAGSPMAPPPKPGDSAEVAKHSSYPMPVDALLEDVLKSTVDGDGSLDLSALLERQLERYLKTCPEAARSAVEFDLPDEPMLVDVRAGFPLLEVMSECLANAAEHGLKMGEKEGVVRVQFTVLPDEGIVEICDTGEALPKGFDLDKVKHGGLSRVKALVAGMGGKITMSANSETRCQINLPGSTLRRPKRG